MGTASRIQHSPFFTFDGGVDEYHDPIMLDKNKLRYAKDIFIDGGMLYYRPGKDLWSLALSYRCDGLHEYIDSSGVAHLLISTNGKVQEITSGSAVDIITGLTQEYMHFTSYRGKCWVNGPTTQKKINGTTQSDVGLARPASAPTVTNSTGSLTGSYAWKVTYVIESGGVRIYESNPSDVSNSLTLSSEGATITPPTSPDSRVNARYIYRTTASGAKYYYEGKISNNTGGATFASGSISDAAIVPQGEAETNHGVPTQARICEGSAYRLFWLVDDYLYWSESAISDSYLEYQKATNQMKLLQSGKGTGLKRLFNKNTGLDDLYVFQESSISVLPGSDPNAPLYSVSQKVGLSQHDTITVYNDMIVFLSNQKTVCVIKDGRVIDISSRNIPKSMSKLVDDTVARAGIIYDNYYALCMRDVTSKIYNSKVWVCDLRKTREVESGYANTVWFPWDIDCEYILQRKDGSVVIVDNNLKRIFNLVKSQKRDDLVAGGQSDVLPEWWTGSWGGDSPLIQKRACVITAIGSQDKGITVIPYASDRMAGQAEIETAGTTFVMGTSTMGSRTTEKPNIKPSAISRSCCGTNLSFKFKKLEYDSIFSILGYEFTYQTFDRFRR